MGYEPFKELLGKTLKRCVREGHKFDNEAIILETSDGKTYGLYHSQTCCENVFIEDICGNLADLVGEPLTLAEESYSDGPTENGKSSSYSLYRFGTKKGDVTIRFYGTSNGYYSEIASLHEIAP